MKTTLEAKSIVKNTLYNNSNVQKVRPVTFLADMEIANDYYKTAPKLAPLKYDVFTPAKVAEEPQKANISFMHRVARFFGLN